MLYVTLPIPISHCMEMNVFETTCPLIKNVRSSEGAVQTQEFLEVCRQILPVVGKLGTGFGLVKSDVGGNIDRLATRAATQPDLYNPDIFQILRDEVIQGTHVESSSCTKGLLWLKRAMQFVVALLHRLAQDRNISLSDAASETYYSTLQQYHGWIVTGTFTVALKLVPGRESFFESVGAGGLDGESGREAVFKSMNEFCVEFEDLLKVVHKFLVENDLDDPARV
ncbi:hypothetical protein Ndes2526B_g05192 [Nannochloris sp. 'desiccata']|nr:putative Glycolipid transfer protein 1 [Chlorella desiccata (nom. nud.)]